MMKSLLRSCLLIFGLVTLQNLSAQGQLQLHLNKSIFVPGEQIWFSAYFLDGSIRPSGEQLLELNLLDIRGETFGQAVVKLSEGSGFGNIRIRKDCTENSLYLVGEIAQKIEARSPVRDIVQINILNPKQDEELHIQADIPFLWASKSGSVLAGKQNTLLFQLPEGTNKPEVAFYEGSQRLEVDLRGKWQGMGQFTYYHNPLKEYKFILTSTKSPQYFPVSATDLNAIGLRINNLEEEHVLVELLSAQKLPASSGVLEFWSEGKTKISSLNTASKQEWYTIPRAYLEEGVIQVRFLVDGELRGQNWFVNQSTQQRNPIRFVSKEVSKDSIHVELQWNEGFVRPNAYSLTVMTSQSYDKMPFRDLKLLNQLNNVVERKNIPRFLKIRSRNRQAKIDHWLRLNIPSENSLGTAGQDQFWHEGYTLKGKVLGKNATNATQMLVQSRSGLFALEPLRSDKSFSIKVIPLVNDTIHFTPLGANGQALLESACEIQMESLKKKDFSKSTPSMFRWYKNQEYDEELAKDWPKAQIELDEVVLTAAKPSTSIHILADFEGRLITDDEAKKYVTLAAYLRKLGYRVQYHEGRVRVISRGIGAGPAIVPVVVPVIVDGQYIIGNDLIQTPLTSVRSLRYDSMRRMIIFVDLKTPTRSAKKHSLIAHQGLSTLASFEKELGLYNKDFLDRFGTPLWMAGLNAKNKLKIKIPRVGNGDYVLLLRGLNQNNEIVDYHLPFSLPNP
jgi:hypothetical protein